MRIARGMQCPRDARRAREASTTSALGIEAEQANSPKEMSLMALIFVYY